MFRTVFFACSMAAIFPTMSEAANCKDVVVVVANYAGEEMRVVQTKAYNSDDDRWRTVSTRNEVLDPLTNSSQVGYGLRPVNIGGSRGERVAVRVKYKFVNGSDNRRYETDSGYATCNNGSQYIVKIPSSGHRLD